MKKVSKLTTALRDSSRVIESKLQFISNLQNITKGNQSEMLKYIN